MYEDWRRRESGKREAERGVLRIKERAEIPVQVAF